MKHNFNLALFPEATIPAATNKQTLNQHLTFKANGTQGRHGWLRLTPAYSVHLVEKLVADCRQEDLVLDPFCGTGTTALVCAQAGIRCHTVDINPFLVWLAQVKCTTYSSEDVRQADNVLRQALFDCENIRQDFWTPPIKDIDKWWEPEILRLLAQIFARIRTSTLDDAAHSLCSIVFCRALIELSSVSFGHQSMSFKKKGAETQLFEVSPLERMQAVFQRISTEIFQSSCEPICEGCGQAFHGDSRHLPLALPLREYTKVITSPPYPNRMSYIRELRPYMYWLGYLDSGRQAGELDWQAIGGTWGCATSKLLSWGPNLAITIPFAGFEEIIHQISQQSNILGLYVAKYFEDTVCHIRSLKEVLAPNAQVHYVVGNSKFYDSILPTEQIYAAIFKAEGFQNVNIEAIRKRTSKKELYEYIVSARL